MRSISLTIGNNCFAVLFILWKSEQLFATANSAIAIMVMRVSRVVGVEIGEYANAVDTDANPPIIAKTKLDIL
jgi:hypothetical protein